MLVGCVSQECKDNGAEQVAIPSMLSKQKYLVDIPVPSHGLQSTYICFLCLVSICFTGPNPLETRPEDLAHAQAFLMSSYKICL